MQNDKMKRNLFHQQHGSLSITSLWILALLTLVGVSLAKKVVMGLRLDSYMWQVTEAEWLARAGVHHAIAILRLDALTDATPPSDALVEPWAYRPKLFRKIACGKGAFEISYTDHDAPSGDAVVYGIIDENRKININRVPREILIRLPEMTPQKIAALLDWRDSDDQPREFGAENSFYQSLDNPYPCKNGELDYLEEITFIKGFTEADVERLRSLVTVYGDGTVNINTASAKVLRILGISANLAKEIVHLRWGKDELPFTTDDVVFRSSVEIVPTLRKLLNIKPEDQMVLNGLVGAGILGVVSTHFTIRSSGIIPGREEMRKKVIATVYRKNRDEIEIVNWEEL